MVVSPLWPLPRLAWGQRPRTLRASSTASCSHPARQVKTVRSPRCAMSNDGLSSSCAGHFALPPPRVLIHLPPSAFVNSWAVGYSVQCDMTASSLTGTQHQIIEHAHDRCL